MHRLIAAFLLFLPRLEAAPVAARLEREAIAFAILDNPEGVRDWYRQQLLQINPDERPRDWVGACWALALMYETEDVALLEERFPRCLALAEQQRMHLEWTVLRYVSTSFHSDEFEKPGIAPALQDLIDAVKAKGDADAQAYLAARIANRMLTARAVDESLPLVMEANRLVDAGATHSLLTWDETKNALSTSLQYRDFNAESEAIDEAMIKRLRGLGIRKALATAIYNRGFSKVQADPLNEAAVTADLTEAMQLADSIQDHFIKGTSLYSLGLLQGRNKNYGKAITWVEQALRIFEAGGNNEWINVCRLLLADYHLKSQHYAKALAVMEGLDARVAEDDKERSNAILWYRFKAYRGLGELDKAIQNLEAFQKASAALAKAMQNEEYNKAAASLNLQLEQEKSKTLIKENQLQQQQLEEARRFRIFVIILACLIFIVLGLLVFAMRQIKRIQASRKKIQMILDHIDEGLLTVDKKSRIGVDYSRYLRDLLGQETPIAGSDFIATVFGRSQLPTEQRAIIGQVLQASFAEERLAWDLNSDNMVKEFRIGPQGERIIAIRWIPIYTRQDTMETLLVSLSDITSARALEKALGAQEQRLRALPDTLRELLQVKPVLMEQLLTRTGRILSDLAVSDEPQRLLREMHTQKGVARTLGLRTLSQDLHELESVVQQLTSSAPIQKALQVVHERLSEYQAFAQILHQAQDSARSLGRNLQAAIAPHLDAWVEQMQKADLPLHEVTVSDGFLQWNEEWLTLASDFYVHGINNALDHGFILPHQRGETITRPTLAIAAHVEGKSLVLSLRDNGGGLDAVKLEALAAKRGFTPQADGTLADVLFEDGVSTAHEVSLTSGRGVGLAAVKAQVVKRGGRIGIQASDRGRGTWLWARLPLGT